MEMQQKIAQLLEQLSLTVPDEKPGYTQPSVTELEKEVKEEFSKYLDPAFVEQNFCLPEDFKEFLTQFKCSYYEKNSASLYDAYYVTCELPYFLELFHDEVEARAEENALLPSDTMWIPFGTSPDKHEYVICCDRSSAVFGKVFDGHDAHPWASGNLFGPDDVEYDCFIDFLKVDAKRKKYFN